MITTNSIIAFSLVALMGTSNAGAEQPALSQETLGEYIANMPVRTAEPFVAYCISELPASKPDFESELILFKNKFRDAAAPMLQKLADDPELSAPVPPEFHAQTSSIRESMLVQIKKSNSAVYCPSMLANMRAATVETLRSIIESAFSKYKGAPNNKPE